MRKREKFSPFCARCRAVQQASARDAQGCRVPRFRAAPQQRMRAADAARWRRYGSVAATPWRCEPAMRQDAADAAAIFALPSFAADACSAAPFFRRCRVDFVLPPTLIMPFLCRCHVRRLCDAEAQFCPLRIMSAFCATLPRHPRFLRRAPMLPPCVFRHTPLD